MKATEFSFLGRTAKDVHEFARGSYEGHPVSVVELQSDARVSTDGRLSRDMRQGVRALASKTFRAVELLKVQQKPKGGAKEGENPICEFVIIELKDDQEPLAVMHDDLPPEFRGERTLYTMLNVNCLREESLHRIREGLLAK